MHRTEPSRLQSMSLQLADKLANLVDNNERILKIRQGIFNILKLNSFFCTFFCFKIKVRLDSLVEINKFVLVTDRSTVIDKDNKVEAIGNVEIIVVEIATIATTVTTATIATIAIIVITIKYPLRSKLYFAELFDFFFGFNTIDWLRESLDLIFKFSEGMQETDIENIMYQSG